MPITARLTTRVLPGIYSRTSNFCALFQAIANGRHPQRHVEHKRRLLMDARTRPSHSGMFPPTAPPSALSPSSSPPPEPSPSTFYALLLTRAAMAVGIVYCVTEYVVDITLCEGPSMSPTIRPYGEIVCIDKWHPRRLGLEDGCVGTERARKAQERQATFVHLHPQQNDEWHQPWISASDLPPPTWKEALRQMRSPVSVGDVVVVHHPSRKGTVCKRVLGLPGDQVLHRQGLLLVPDGHVWLEGDNSANSSDSRSYGPVPAALILGRVVARLWPLRGEAWMVRGGRPRQRNTDVEFFGAASASSSGSTVLPAGYEGQHIRKLLAPDEPA